MRKHAATSLALGLTLALAGCATLEEALMSPGPMVTARPTAAATAPSSTGSPTGTPTGTATEPQVDQSTPEAAMESWLTALVAGDGEQVCRLMATEGRAVARIKGAVASCGESLTPLLTSLKDLGGMFEDIEIVGATVVDDLATFEAATTRPSLAAQVIHRFKAVKIKDAWYVTE